MSSEIFKLDKPFLSPRTITQSVLQAGFCLNMYQALFNKFNGNAIAMYRWLHTKQKNLDNSPHLLIVDEYKIALLVDYLSIKIE